MILNDTFIDTKSAGYEISTLPGSISNVLFKLAFSCDKLVIVEASIELALVFIVIGWLILVI
ncbi:hypothetical protein PT309_03620 [Metamycoplasma hyosynoviae]|uniref:hypothetical protein n=1 Tax=Metamycoplasma hyosynoviae TaxID=29559 RepID=UPI00235FA4AB|nr:hypothetical protein [Metamycoplasma hyosynoviae]MDD1373964.1 hypothetical protein [Metamycoplasma hyosynoviae]